MMVLKCGFFKEFSGVNLTQYAMSSKFVLGIICQNMDSSTPHYFNVHCQCVGMLHSSAENA